MSKRGIEGNHAKIKAIQDMPEPRNIKNMQCLAGRIASLGQFLSRVGENGLALYHILKTASNFECTKEASVVFQELKAYLSSPPLFVIPLENEHLYLYMVVTIKVVSFVLCILRDNKMSPIYYMRHVLNAPNE